MGRIGNALSRSVWLMGALALGCGGDAEPDPAIGQLPGAVSGMGDAGALTPPASGSGTGGGTSLLPPANTNPGGGLTALDAGTPPTSVSPGTPASDAGSAVSNPSADGSSATGGGATASGVAPILRGSDPTKESASAKGPYKVTTYTSGFPVMLYGGGTLHYPSDAEPPFAAVAICPGFTAAQSSIQSWGPFLASHGIVALTMDTATPLDVVDQRVEELMDALASIKSENARSGGPLYQKIDTMRLGVMGWSMGGGGTWLAADMHPELRSAVTFAGHIATAVNQDVSMIKVPTLMFAGSTDNLILGGGMSQPVYDMIPASTPKMVWEVQGAGHDVANNPANTSGAIGRYGLSWQKVFLEGDERYRKFLLEMPPTSSYFKTNLK